MKVYCSPVLYGPSSVVLPFFVLVITSNEIRTQNETKTCVTGASGRIGPRGVSFEKKRAAKFSQDRRFYCITTLFININAAREPHNVYSLVYMPSHILLCVVYDTM